MADNFYYNTKMCLSKDILKNLTEEITVKAPKKYRWALKYPESVDKVVDTVMLETTTFGIWDKITETWEGGHKRYLKLFKPPVVSLNPKEEEILNKYNYNGAFSQEELRLLKKWYQGTDFSEEEKTVIKNWYQNPTKPEDSCHPLNDVEHISGFSYKDVAVMKMVVYARGFENSEELLKLYVKQLKGEVLLEEETALLKKDEEKRRLTYAEQIKIDLVKKRRGLNNFVYKNEDDTIAIPVTSEQMCILVIFESIGMTSGSVSSINLMNPSVTEKPIPDTEVLASYRRSRVLTNEEKTQVIELQSKLNNRNALMFQIGSAINEDTPSEFMDNKSSLPARLAWYKYVHSNLSEYAGLDYWINLTNDSLNLVVRGDASTDIYPYNNWLKSYAYVGALEPMNKNSVKDEEFNWCMTASSDIDPAVNIDTTTENLSLDSQKYGFRTANGVTDLTVMGTRIGIPYQPHYPAFFTANPYMDNQAIDGSRWNGNKKDFSEVAIKHSFDGLRGKMKNVLVGENININDGDRLMYQTEDDKTNSEMYLKFFINAPKHFLQNSPNVEYCVAIRVSVDEFFQNNYCENCDYKQFATDNGYGKA